jgi:hypothetical protein
MHKAIQGECVTVSDLYFLQSAFLVNAEKLLQEVYLLDRENLDLDILSIYHQELSWMVENFPVQLFGQHILPELKSYRLAFTCSIESRQNADL